MHILEIDAGLKNFPSILQNDPNLNLKVDRVNFHKSRIHIYIYIFRRNGDYIFLAVDRVVSQRQTGL